MPTLFRSLPALNTTDVDEARARVGNVFCPHRLEPLAGDVAVRLRSASVGSVGLNYLDYGSPVSIDPGRLGDFYLVQIPLAGRAVVRQDGEEIVSRPGLASVVSSGASVSMTWGRANPQLIFYAARSAVERHVERSTGRPVLAPVRFSLGMDMSTPAAQAWSRGLRYLRDEIVNASPSLADPTAVRHLEQLMLGGLLAAQRHNYRDDAAVRPAVSRTVRQACSLINDRIGEQLSASDVADALQVSLRALQDGFRRDLQTSMSAYIRDRRLDRAHRALGEVGSTSVTEVACDLGITHLGRFSVQYKARFGQSPSETLAQH